MKNSPELKKLTTTRTSWWIVSIVKKLGKWVKLKNSKNVVVGGLNVGKLGKSHDSETIDEKKDREQERNDASQSSKASRNTFVRDTQCLPQLRKEIDVSSELMTSQARSCRGPRFAKIGNEN